MAFFRSCFDPCDPGVPFPACFSSTAAMVEIGRTDAVEDDQGRLTVTFGNETLIANVGPTF